jgi:hypothetical protein
MRNSLLPLAGDATGLIERLIEMFRDSAASARRLAEPTGCCGPSPETKNFNEGWDAAMLHAANLAAVAVAAYKGEPDPRYTKKEG